MIQFGRHVFVYGVVLYAKKDQSHWKSFLTSLVKRIRMTPMGDMQVTEYPGEIGSIYFQCIGESFIAVDVWPNHEAAYLHIVSCKKFKKNEVDALCKEFNLFQGQKMTRRLGLDNV